MHNRNEHRDMDLWVKTFHVPTQTNTHRLEYFIISGTCKGIVNIFLI